MSADAQPRKRKDKKKKKDEREILGEKMSAAPGRAVTPPPTPVPPISSDEIMHIYKEGKVGGSTFTKALFFGIMTALALTISIVIMSSPGRDVIIQQEGEEGVSTSAWSLDLGLPLWSSGPEEGHEEEHAEDSGQKEEHGDHEEQHEEGDEGGHGEHEEQDEGGFMSWLGWGGGSSEPAAEEQHQEEEHAEEHSEEQSASEGLSSWFGWGGGDESPPEEPSEQAEESSSSSWFGWGSTEEPVQEEDAVQEQQTDTGEASEEVVTSTSGKRKVDVEAEELPEEEEEEEKEQEDEADEPEDEADEPEDEPEKLEDEADEEDTAEPMEEDKEDPENDNLSQPEEDDDDDELDTFLRSLDLEPNLKRDSRAHIQQDRARQQRAAAEERAREERAREERARELRMREERARQERARELRAQEERAERARELRAQEERAREMRLREERAREMRLREERAREEIARLERLRQEQILQKQREEQEEREKEEKKVLPVKKKVAKVSEEDVELFPEAAEALRLEQHDSPPPQEEAGAEETVETEEEAPFSRDDLVDEDLARAEEEEEQEEEEVVVEEKLVKEKVAEVKVKPAAGSVAAKASEFLAERAAERAVRETQAPLRDLPPPPSQSPEPSDEEEQEELSDKGYSGGEEVVEEEEEEEEQGGGDLYEEEEEESPVGSDIELEEDEEELSEDEEVPKSAPPQQRNSGAQGYEHEDITDDYDWAIREELDLAEEELRRNPSACLQVYKPLQLKYDMSPRLRVAVAKCLDFLSKEASSNKLLESAIQAYKRALQLNMKDRLFLDTTHTLIARLRFRGFISETIGVHEMVISRFGDDPKHRTELAISYLMLNKLKEAERVLNKTVGRWPYNGAARAHYGLALKLQGKHEESIPHLEQGLQLDQEATKDARFYFHLGDAFVRTGQPLSADKTYEKGVSLGLFRSKYQRSLYNVERLTARPWWTLQQTTYTSFFRKLESNWKSIREEGLKAIEYKKGFLDESESLRHTGDWKQFELFARGVKNVANCQRAKLTCQLISEFEPARGCRRGQAKFSVMEKGTHVWPHCGPTNCRLRAHLGLVVPSGPEIRVANITRKWVEGQVIIFDDSFEHEVWHRGSESRLVLIVDVWHPDLTSTEMRTLSPI